MTTSQDQLLHALTPTIDGQPIRIADNHRHLGVILSSNLNWSSHACNMLQTAAKRAGLLRVMSNDLPLPVATRLYIYYVRPTMEYACAVWHGSLREDIALSLERIQASVARRLLRADWFTPKGNAPGTAWMASTQMAARDLKSNAFSQTFYTAAQSHSVSCSFHLHTQHQVAVAANHSNSFSHKHALPVTGNPFSIALPFSGTLSHKTFKHTPTAPHSGKPLNSTGQHTDTQPNKNIPIPLSFCPLLTI